MPDHVKLAHPCGGEAIYRRHHRKADGRDLWLYSHAPHTTPVSHESGGETAKGGELRFHPLRREWNIYAPHRQNRTFKPSAAEDPLAPTLPGGPETEIPFADFELAVFDNKFTSLHVEAPIVDNLQEIHRTRAAGHCDVIVYGPEATGNLASIGQAKRELLLAAWLDRYQAHFSAGYDYVLPFENRGDAVGVTLHHPHGQIYAFPIVPSVQQKAVDAFDAGFDLAAHIAKMDQAYRITQAGGVSAFCPAFARFPFEVWIAPDRQITGPWDFTNEEARGFTALLGDITARYDRYFGTDTPYMLSLQAAPRTHMDSRFHFTAQFYPLLRAPGRVKYLASVEQVTGVFTVDVMPEFAAKALRDAGS